MDEQTRSTPFTARAWRGTSTASSRCSKKTVLHRRDQADQAVETALERVSEAILDSHLKTCVMTAVQSAEPAERERVLSEITEVFRHTARP